MKKMLLALDDSPCAMKAVEYAGRQFSGAADLQITLVHVLPNLPAIFWDEGHILSGDEKKDRKKVVDTWLSKQKQKIEPVMQSAVKVLARHGIKAESIATKFISDSTDVAESILEEARDGGCQTIVMGRCGIAEGKRLLLGSVTSKVIHLGAKVAICIVE
jgi:nucleotide-binding universal stress UspA family protein